MSPRSLGQVHIYREGQGIRYMVKAGSTTVRQDTMPDNYPNVVCCVAEIVGPFLEKGYSLEFHHSGRKPQILRRLEANLGRISVQEAIQVA